MGLFRVFGVKSCDFEWFWGVALPLYGGFCFAGEISWLMFYGEDECPEEDYECPEEDYDCPEESDECGEQRCLPLRTS
jgi:hypothetical protein